MIRWLDHTADVQMEIVCNRFEDVFVDFVEGLKTLLVTGAVQANGKRGIDLREADPCGLLVSLGRYVLSCFYGDGFVPSRFTVQEATERRLKGEVEGEPFDPGRHAFHLEVKGVTYHDLQFERWGGKWRAVVTIDI